MKRCRNVILSRGWSTASLLHPALLGPANEASGSQSLWARAPTKQSHKPSVDLATDDCDTSLRSSRVGASLNPEALCSAAGLPPASARLSQEDPQLLHPPRVSMCVCACVCIRWTERGGRVFFFFSWQTVNLQECSEQEPPTTTQIHIRLMQGWLSVMEAQNHQGDISVTSERGGQIRSSKTVIKAMARLSNSALSRYLAKVTAQRTAFLILVNKKQRLYGVVFLCINSEQQESASCSSSLLKV